MPVISDKGRLMPESPIRKLVPYAEEARKRGTRIYHLNIGQPDIRTPEGALDALRKTNLEVIGYGHSAGNESYRIKLGESYRKIGIEVDHSEILVTTGGSEAVLFALMSCIDPGGEVIIPEPYYANYNGFSVAAGISPVPVVSRIEDDFALPPVSQFEKLIGPATRGILLCNPNNPTGYLYTADEMEQIGALVRKHDLFLFSDEVYREFCYDGHSHFSAMKLKGLNDHVIMLDSVSKRFSACGMRVGALVSKNREVISTALKFGQARLSPPVLGQIAAEAALETPPGYFSEVREEYTRRRDFLVGRLNRMEGVVSPTPKGAFYTIASLPVDDADDFCRWMLSDFSFKGQTVMMAPASGFYSAPELGRQQVRIAYVLNIDDLEHAMECLEQGLSEYPGKT